MKEILERILSLQTHYSSSATSKMVERGRLIRDDLRDAVSDIAASYGWLSKGSDGVGQKARVPWTRVYHEHLSPTPRQGWYVVYLFKEDGTGLSCSLNQGTTTWTKGAFVPHPPSQLRARAAWARDQLKLAGADLMGLRESILLGKGELATAYENGHIVGYEYNANSLPESQILYEHLEHLLSLLEILYQLDSLNPPPGDPDPMVRSLEYAISEHAGKKIRDRAPRLVDAEERQAIEIYAMGVVEIFFKEEGWKTKDTHNNKPYDFEIRRGDETIYVEVKGTTTNGTKVILTRNEVIHNKTHFPNTCLAIVRQIEIKRMGNDITCSGGHLELFRPWYPELEDLEPMAYEYLVPKQ